MTTTVEKILAKATEFDQKAAALRLAASLLNGDATHRKQATAAQTVQQAITIRQAQRPATKKAARTPKRGTRLTPILAALTSTPQTRQELHARVPSIPVQAISTALNTLLHRKQVKKTADGWTRA